MTRATINIIAADGTLCMEIGAAKIGRVKSVVLADDIIIREYHFTLVLDLFVTHQTKLVTVWFDLMTGRSFSTESFEQIDFAH